MQLIRKFLVRLLKIDRWHEFNKKNYVQYAIDITEWITERKPKSGNKPLVIEIGCGTGDIIGNIKTRAKKEGYDIDKRIAFVANILNPHISVHKGSFSDIKGRNISCLLVVNVLHFLEPDYVKTELKRLLQRNVVEYIVIDELRNTKGTEYNNEVDGKILFEGHYELAYRSRRYKASNGAYRHVCVYKNVGEH